MFQKYKTNLVSLVPGEGATPCLIHCDLWCNNIMSSESELMFLDWQFLSQGDNMFDLGMTILHNTNFAGNTTIINELLSCYYNTFNATIIKMRGNGDNETFDEFSQRFYTDGVKSAFVIGAIIDEGFLNYETLVDRVYNMAKMMK